MEQSKTTINVKRTGLMVTLLAAAFVTSMATTVTGNMIPNFTSYFRVSSGTAQWLTSGATLLSGITIPLTAFLIKKISNKVYFFVAMLAFAIGSMGAFLSGSFTVLLISRLVQAVGCGMLLPFAQVVLLQLYPKEKHGTIMAAYSMAATVSAVVGPTYAGLLLDTVGWRGVFVSLFAIGVVIVILGTVFMYNVTEKQEADLNIPFILLSSFGFLTFLIGVNNISGGILQFKSGGLILTGIILLALFSVLQLKSEKPMLNLRVFKNPTFTTALLLSVCLYLISMGNGMILPIFTKSIRMFSDTAYGMATIAGAIIGVFATMFAGRIYDKMGIRPMAVVSIGLFAVFSVMGMLFSDSTSIIYIGVVYALQNVAMSSLNSPVTAMALSGLKGQERVDGSAIYNTLRQISSSLASTLSILIFTLFGSDLNAIHCVFSYFAGVTVVITVLICVYLWQQRKDRKCEE